LALHHRLEILGIFVGAALADIARFFGLVDIVGDLLAALGDEEMEARLLLLITLTREGDLLLVVDTPACVSMGRLCRHCLTPYCPSETQPATDRHRPSARRMSRLSFHLCSLGRPCVHTTSSAIA